MRMESGDGELEAASVVADDVVSQEGFVFKNWSRTFTAEPKLFFEPENEAQLRGILLQAKLEKAEVKVIGSGLSPSDIACTSGYMISMNRMNKVLDLDTNYCTITVQAGVTIDYLNQYVLPENGLAFQNLGSVSEPSVGGIIATGTHGTGINFGSFATCVLELWIMTSDGNITHCSQTDNSVLFSAARCHLGILGVVVAAKLQCEPAFLLNERQIPCTLDYLLDNFYDLASSTQHFRAMWFPHTDHAIVKCADRSKQATFEKRNWIRDLGIGYYLLEFCLWVSTFFPSLVPIINKIFYKLCYSAKLRTVKRSDQIFNINCLFEQYVTEWAIPRHHSVELIRKMKQWLDENSNVRAHFPVEIRVVKRDGIMVSPSGDEDVTYIGIISFRPYGKFVAHDEWWNFFEKLCKGYGGKPHWAKEHKENSAYFRRVYKNFDKFMAMRDQLDPTGMFINSYWRRVLK